MTTTSADIVNRAVQLIGGYDNNPPVTGTPPNFDGTTIGKAAGAIYVEVLQSIGREFGYDFSRNVAALVATLNTAPLGWAYEYLYPTNGIQVRQILPAALADANDPLPINWEVGNALVSSVAKKVIWANEANAKAKISNQPPEDTWDPLFSEAVVQMLASKLSMAVPGRPDTMRELYGTAANVQQVSTTRDS